jgi:PEP-CTERM motif
MLSMTGSILSYRQTSPYTLAADGVGGIDTAGFATPRTHDNITFPFGAFQDTLTPTAHLIHGFGQLPSSFAALGLTPLVPAEQPIWGVPLWIGTGTYDKSKSEPAMNDVRDGVNVFGGTLPSGVMSASVAKKVVHVPEPASIVLAALALAGCAAIARRRRG